MAETIPEAARPEPKAAPPNPFYEREWICSLDNGRAVLTISAPGGVIAPQAAQDVVDWLELILVNMRRKAVVDTAASQGS